MKEEEKNKEAKLFFRNILCAFHCFFGLKYYIYTYIDIYTQSTLIFAIAPVTETIVFIMRDTLKNNTTN